LNCSAVTELEGLLSPSQEGVPGPHPEIPEFRPYPPALQHTATFASAVGKRKGNNKKTKQLLLDNIVGAIARQRTTNQWKNGWKLRFLCGPCR
jgi:hypothetical protein